MAIQLSATRVTHELLGTIFLLVSISCCGTVRAQSMQWSQFPAPQPQQPYAVAPGYAAPQQQFLSAAPQTQMAAGAPQMFRAPAQSMPAPAYAAPTAQPYFVASRQAPSPQANTLPMPNAPQPPAAAQAQYPVTPMESAPCYQGGQQPQYAPSEQWNQPAMPGNVGYGSGYCGTDSYGSGYGGGYCAANAYACAPPVQWFGSAGVLMLDRDDENHRFYSYNSDNEAQQLLDSTETNFSWAGGVEAHVGRMDMCSCTGCEAVYWGLFPDADYAYVYPSQIAPGDLNGIFNFDQLDYNGQTADNYVNGAAVHRLHRSTELHNVEFNRIWNFGGCCGTSCCSTGCDPCCDPCCSNAAGRFGGHGHGRLVGNGGVCGSGCTFGVLTGFRYLRFEDNISFASDPNDTMFTGEADELYYNIDCDNDLWGWQFGGFGEKALAGSRFSLTFGAKAGVFLNDADARSTIGGSAGLATINNGPNQGIAWDIQSSDDSLATIAELQAGAAYAFAPTWRIRGDYRIIGISGVALPTNQIYQDLRGIQDVAIISTNGDLILHGVFVGVERTY